MERQSEALEEATRRLKRRIGNRGFSTASGRSSRREILRDGPNMCMVDQDGGGMSACSAHSNHDLQKRCPFYEKAEHANRCMELKFDEFCGCVKAQ